MRSLIRTGLAALACAGLAAAPAVTAHASPAAPVGAVSATRSAAAPSPSNGASAVVGANGWYHVFAVNNAGKVQQGIYVPGHAWSWQTILSDGVVRGTPGVTYTPVHNRFDVFAVGTNGQMYQSTASYGSAWKYWHTIGGSDLIGGASAVIDRSGTYHVFAVNGAGVLMEGRYLGGRWSWQSTGTSGQVLGTPGVEYNAAGNNYFVADTGLNGKLYTKVFLSGWSTWQSQGGSSLHSGADVVQSGEDILIFTVNDAGNLYINTATGRFTNLGGVVRGTPGAVVTGGSRVDVFAVGTNGSMYQKIYANGRNGAWGRIGGSDLA